MHYCWLVSISSVCAYLLPRMKRSRPLAQGLGHWTMNSQEVVSNPLQNPWFLCWLQHLASSWSNCIWRICQVGHFFCCYEFLWLFLPLKPSHLYYHAAKSTVDCQVWACQGSPPLGPYSISLIKMRGCLHVNINWEINIIWTVTYTIKAKTG